MVNLCCRFKHTVGVSLVPGIRPACGRGPQPARDQRDGARLVAGCAASPRFTGPGCGGWG